MSRTENPALRRSKRIQQRKRSEVKHKNKKKLKLQEDTQYFSQAVQLSDGRIHIARVKQVTVRGVPVEHSVATLARPEKNRNVLPSTSNQKAIQGSAVSQNKKKEKLSGKLRRKSNKKETPATSSSKTKKKRQRRSRTEVPNKDSSVAQSCSSFQLSGELSPTNTIRLCESNSKHQYCHSVNMPNSITVLKQLSDRNTERHTSAQRQHVDTLGHPQPQESVNEFYEHNTQAAPINTNQSQTMPQVSNIDKNCTPGQMPHNVTYTQEAPAVLRTNQMQNTYSRQLFPPRPNVYCPHPSYTTHNPSIHPRRNIYLGCCLHPRASNCPNSTAFNSQMTTHPVQQVPLSSNCQGPDDVPDLPLTQHFQQANTVQHFVHHINPPISNSLAGSVDHHSSQNQQSGYNNILPSSQGQGTSSQGTTSPQVFSYNKYASLSAQQHSNSRGQTQHTVFLPFYGNTPVEIEIK